jgi:FkbM family methyltransferase
VRRLVDDPYKRLRGIGVAEGLYVVDVGAGRGYFALAATDMVGRQGSVWAVEPDTNRAGEIRRRAQSAQAANLHVLEVKAEEIDSVPSGTVDLAFSFYSMHHIDDKPRCLDKIERLLKEGGVFNIRDFRRNWLTRHGVSDKDIEILKNSKFSEITFSASYSYISMALKK